MCRKGPPYLAKKPAREDGARQATAGRRQDAADTAGEDASATFCGRWSGVGAVGEGGARQATAGRRQDAADTAGEDASATLCGGLVARVLVATEHFGIGVRGQ